MRFLLLLFIFALPGYASDFDDGMRLYGEGKYPESAERFRAAMNQETSGEIFFNLANASFRSRKMGDAIFYYRSALDWMPRDADLRFNLNYARKKSDETRESRVGGEWIYDYFPWSRTEALTFMAGITVLLFGLSLSELLFPLKALTWLRRMAAIGWVIWGVGTLSLFFITARFGVVTVGEAKVYSGFGQNNPVLFSLSEGAAFTVGGEQGEWVQIQLPDGKKGWLAKADARVSN